MRDPISSNVTPRSRWAFWGVMLSFLVHGLIVATWVSRVASVKVLLHLTDGALGLALLGTAIGSVIAIPLCGWAVGRYGSRQAVRWTGIGFSLALALPGAAWNASSLFAALFIFGAMGGANDVAMNAQAVGTEKLLRSAVMSRFHAMFSIGGIAGASAGSFVASHAIGPLRHLSGAAAVILPLALIAPWLMVDTAETAQAAGRRNPRGVPAALLFLSLIAFCIFLSEGAVADWAGVYLQQVMRTTDAIAALGYAIFSATMAVFRLAGDAIVTRLGRARTVRWGAIVAAAGMVAVISAHSSGWALFGFALAGVGYSSIIPQVFAASGRVPPITEGAGVATVSGIGYLAFLLGPPLIGYISDAASLRAGLSVLVVLGVVSAAAVSAVQRNGAGPLSRDESSPPGTRIH